MRSGCLELALAIESPLGYPLGSPLVSWSIRGPYNVLCCGGLPGFKSLVRSPMPRTFDLWTFAAIGESCLRLAPCVGWAARLISHGQMGWWGWTARAVELGLVVL